MEAILGCDIGTTTCKAILVSRDGETLAEVVLPYAARGPVHDPQQWWAAVRDTIRSVMARASGHSVVAMGLCGRGSGLAFLGGNGEPLPVPWASLASEVGRVPRVKTRRYSKLAAWGRAAEAFRRVDPAAADRLRSLCGVKDYINFVLTGRLATDPFSANTREWPRSTERYRVQRSWLPRISPGEEPLGPLKSDIADELGLPRGIPVAVGGHDGVCANLGAGMVEAGQGCVTLGTVGVIRVNTTRPLYPTRFCHTFTYPFIDGLWASGGDLPTGGVSVLWLAR
ncbi:xylulokinase [Geochorda subterranea]|uniref:FGGY-family carbohydrate kinase n=1 Tax=Geochorda subterranea TaxID=3109564 RepID=A0ABZ1BR88_9FIRM|nr:FGGY-family carbohydrate kinase [Limnochorda sp. LNt]WRP15135.1 FGGY-family carbohydrate kinase [Limnochorda sp. LNt]